MSQAMAVNNDVRDLISEIISKYNFGENPVIKYNTGSSAGEGYLTNTVAVTISNTGKETIKLFVKYALSGCLIEVIPLDKLYSNEVHFYNTIFPTFAKFLEEKNVQDGFRNVPRCYGVSLENAIALENLKENGYILFDRTQVMNDAHIELTFKSLAKLHAISLALKDQDEEKYRGLVEKTYDVFTHHDTEIAHQARTNAIKEFVNSLDPIEDKAILDRCHDLPDRVIKFVQDTPNIKNKYTVLIQGDCWCNNLMFLYENDNKENPLDIMLIDWQMIRNALPVYDLSFFFYTIASKESLDRLDHFLNVYYRELSEQIRKLGSDPHTLYPYSVFEQHWKEYSKIGFIVGLLSIRLILTEPDETMNFEELDNDAITSYPAIRNHAEYLRRLKILAKHLIENGCL